MAGGIPGATKAVGQRGLQRSLCCRQALAADAPVVLAANTKPSALLSTPCTGQCDVLELPQHMTFTSCCVMRTWQPWPAASGQKQRHTRAAQLVSWAVTCCETRRSNQAPGRQPTEATRRPLLLILHAAAIV